MGGPIDVATKPSKPPKEKYYPCLYLDWDDEYDLPSEGIMEVRFKKKSETIRDSDGKRTQSVELEIQEILDVESEAEDVQETAGEALDRYRNGK